MHEFVIGGILRDDDVVVDSETGIKLHPDLQINQLQAPEMQQVDETPIQFWTSWESEDHFPRGKSIHLVSYGLLWAPGMGLRISDWTHWDV